MTLSTDIYILDKVDPETVFAYARAMCIADAGQGHRADEIGIDRTHNGDKQTIAHRPGSGLNAWLEVYHNGEAPVRARDVHGEFCDDDCDGKYHQPVHHLRINFDTAYSYCGPAGEGCAVLHAKYIVHIGTWLDSQGIRWGWRNEFSGEQWFGDDRYRALQSFMGSGDDAIEWFKHIMTPNLPFS